MRLVLTTCPKEKSKKLIDEVLKLKLAGCVLDVCLSNSNFWWEGKIDRAEENLIIFKTRDDLVKKLFKKIKELHPYKIPFIGEISIKNVNKGYEKWLKEVTR